MASNGEKMPPCGVPISESLTVTEQFRVGGDAIPGLLRGHDPEAFRGRQVVSANAELRWALSPSLDGIAFVDAARVSHGPDPTSGIRYDPGFGVRWFMGESLPLALFWARGSGRGRTSFAVHAGF